MLNNHILKIKRRVLLILVLAIVLFLLMVFADYPLLVERYYSKGLYRLICNVLHPLFNLFPFSVGDFFYTLIVIYLCYALTRLIIFLLKGLFWQAGIYLSGLIAGAEIFVLAFYLFWGLNYYRPSAGELLDLRDTSYTTENLKNVTAILIDSANICRSRLTIADLNQGNGDIYKTAVLAIKKISTESINFRTYMPCVKSSILTPILNYIGTSGYFNPFTGEAQINSDMPVFTRPLVACHEMSHQMGYGAEDEANFAGFLAGIGSGDKLLRYSSYQLAVGECMQALHYRDSLVSRQLRPRISQLVHNDFVTERNYWRFYQNKAGKLSSIFYDDFLKANNQPQGLDTYNRMVLLVMALYKSSNNKYVPQ